MKKICRWILVLTGLLLLVCGCGKTAEQSTEGTEEAVESQETVTLKWGLFAAESDFMAETQKQLNEELKRRGLPYSVEFLGLAESFEYDYKEYVDSYIRNVKAEDCDIVECGNVQDCYDVHEMMIGEGVLAPWKEWLENREEGIKVKEAYPELVWKENTYHEQIYGLPTINTKFNYYAVFNLETAEKYQVDPENFDIFEMEPVLKRAKDGEEEAGNTSFVPLLVWPSFLLGDYEYSRCFLIGIREEDGMLRAENILCQEDYLKQSEQLNRWSSEGVFLDRAENQAGRNGFLLAGIPSYSEAAAENRCRATYNIPEDIRLKAVRIPEFSGRLSNMGGIGDQVGVVDNSAHKEEAFALLSAIYSDASLSDLMVYGKEGKDYQIENGRAVRPEENLTTIVKEKAFGNPLLTLPGVYDSEVKNTELWEAVESLPSSAQHGIAVYDEEMLQKISAINAMVLEEEYYSALGGRSENWERDLAELQKKAAELGLDEVVEKMNRHFQEAGR